MIIKDFISSEIKLLKALKKTEKVLYKSYPLKQHLTFKWIIYFYIDN